MKSCTLRTSSASKQELTDMISGNVTVVVTLVVGSKVVLLKAGTLKGGRPPWTFPVMAKGFLPCASRRQAMVAQATTTITFLAVTTVHQMRLRTFTNPAGRPRT